MEPAKSKWIPRVSGPRIPLVSFTKKVDFSRMRAGVFLRKMGPLLSLLLAVALTPEKAAAAWTLLSVDGRDYVPFSEVAGFYDFPKVTLTPQSVTLVKPNKILTAQLGSREVFLNNLRFYLSLKVVERGGSLLISRFDLAKVLDPVLRPARIQGAPVRTIVLDAGHGGTDQGTWSFYGSEKQYTLDMVRRIAPILKEQGLEIVFTRTGDRYIGLDERVQIANRYPDALFASIHFNAGASVGGIETYALTPAGVPSSDGKPMLTDFQLSPGNALDPENIALATAVHGAILQRIHLRDRGIRRARFHVLKGVKMPGVLVEGGYLGGMDAFSIAHAAYRQVLAEAIAAGIIRYIAAVPAVPPPTLLTTAPPPAEPGTLPKAATLVQSSAPSDGSVSP